MLKLVLLLALTAVGCRGSVAADTSDASSSDDGGTAHSGVDAEPGLGFGDAANPVDAAYPVCADDGGTVRLDGGNCEADGCGPGAVCMAEVGGVAGGGGSWCSPVPAHCENTRTCACMGACACPHELCLESKDASIGGCDNLVR